MQSGDGEGDEDGSGGRKGKVISSGGLMGEMLIWGKVEGNTVGWMGLGQWDKDGDVLQGEERRRWTMLIGEE